jgi:ribosomal protein S27E
MDTNPLRQYFRQPAIYIRLPSGGKFYPPGALIETANNEYPVYAMTTMDEITYRTPDALFNGTAVTAVIQSCVPAIQDAWKIPGMDLDTILIAIRIATYGHELDLDTKCPKCEHEAAYGVDLRGIMEKIRAPDYNQALQLGDLRVHFRPMTYQQMNDNSMAQFEEQKIMQVLTEDPTGNSDQVSRLGEVLKKITAITTRALAQNIKLVEVPGTQVTDSNHIMEWLSNCDRNTFARIRDHIIDSKAQGEIPPLDIKCQGCGHDYQQNFTLDMTNFFAAAS